MDISVDEEDFLAHFGVKGMHWGIRKDRAPGASSKTDREARKDAQEHARAQMFYGEGAGTRRKLIKATVEAKSKKDPSYKSAFDHHISNQDMSTHAQKARTERSLTDKKRSVKRGTKYVARRVTGEMGSAAAFTALAIAGGAFLNSPKGRQFLDTSNRHIQDAFTDVKRRNNARNINRFIND